jgi:hypothetical protein
MEVDNKIISMYENIGYLGMYGTDVLITVLILAITLGIVSFSTYKAIINELKDNWNTNKCNPIVMPFAGLIMPVPGQSAGETTFENFNYCIQQDMSAIFQIIMMPFEFILYLTIAFLDMVLELILALIELLNWIKNQLSELFEEMYNKIVNFIIPVIEIVVHVRDMLGKINGIITTALFTMMNIYNLTVSGLLNIINILIGLLIALITTLLAIMAAVTALYLLPGGGAVAAPMQAAAMVTILGILTPILIICVIFHFATLDIFKEISQPPPKNPF